MRVGIFTDPHYSSRAVSCGVRFNSQSLKKIQAACRFFERTRCDLIVCLGDLIDKENDHAAEIENLKRIAAVFRACAVPTVCLMGNHDAFCFTKEEFYSILGADTLPLDRVLQGKRLVFLDACYFAGGARYMPGDTDWTDSFFPYGERLRETVFLSNEDVYVFVHQNLDPAADKRHRIANADGVNNILLESGKVKAVFQGHYHPGCRNVWNGIRFVTFPAMCESDDAFFTEEI